MRALLANFTIILAQKAGKRSEYVFAFSRVSDPGIYKQIFLLLRLRHELSYGTLIDFYNTWNWNWNDNFVKGKGAYWNQIKRLATGAKFSLEKRAKPWWIMGKTLPAKQIWIPLPSRRLGFFQIFFGIYLCCIYVCQWDARLCISRIIVYSSEMKNGQL